jgi:hypothetical protein
MFYQEPWKERKFGPMELLSDLEKACNIVKQGKDVREKDNAVQALMYGTVDVAINGAKELLHRRALFITLLRERKIWGYPGFWKEDEDEDEEEEVVAKV